jgi:hypothetical protein
VIDLLQANILVYLCSVVPGLSMDIFRGYPDYQFLNLHPGLANTGEIHEGF